MYWVKFLHVLGVIVYVGGFMALTRLVGHAVKFETVESRRDAYRVYRRMHMFADWGGLVVAIVFGTILLMQAPGYMKQGWFHAKLACVLGLMIVDVWFSIILFKKLKPEGPQPKRAVFSAIHGIAALILVGMLVALFPFGMR